jgi:glycosyltransferase involved in cell wall biosynthesis
MSRRVPARRSPRRRPTLIHLTTTDISLALLLQPQLKAFADAGYDVIGMSAPGPYVDDLARDGIRHEPIKHFTRRMAPQHDALALRELRRAFRRLQPDIVHTHNPKPGVLGRLAARWVRVPAVVNTVHGLYALPSDRAAKRWLVYGLERVAARCSDAELVQNVEDIPVLDHLGIRAPKVRLLGNGIDLSRFDAAAGRARRAGARAELEIDESTIVVGAVGRLVAEKGYRELFAAARALKTTAPNVLMLVVGPDDTDKPDAITSIELSQATAMGGVRFLGEQRDVERLYAAMDVFIIASWREGFSRSGMEAAAMGLPVIATDVRGCRQVVDHERTGLLIPVRDPEAIVEAVQRLAADADLRRRMGDAGADMARREFDQQRVIDITLATYAEVLGGEPVTS